VGRSFRLNENLLNVLTNEAAKEGISPNALLNKILQDYCQFHRHLKNFPSILLTQDTFSTIITKISPEDARKIGTKAGYRGYQDILRTLGLKVNQQNIQYLLETIYGNYGKWFIYTHHNHKNKKVYHLRHTLGENWSILVSALVSTLFEEGLNQKTETENLENAVTVQVPRNQTL
jgi:hypothetical protein